MFKKADFFFLLAVMISFFVSGYLWFSGQRMEGIFTAIWVPAILGFGIYFKLMAMGAGTMNDITLLITGVVVFGLMLIAMVLTVFEFKQLGKQQKAKLTDSKRSPDDA